VVVVVGSASWMDCRNDRVDVKVELARPREWMFPCQKRGISSHLSSDAIDPHSERELGGCNGTVAAYP
jgi:hypothetical protein